MSYENMHIDHYNNLYTPSEYKLKMLNNNNHNNIDVISSIDNKLYKIKLEEETPVYIEDCYEKCNETECIKLYEKRKILNKCLECNSQKNKCYNKSIIGGVCNDCETEDIKDKIDCYDIHNFGCPLIDDLESTKGVSPYYIEVPDNNVNSPYNKKCVFCWNILNNI
jgi:hypothetical protein